MKDRFYTLALWRVKAGHQDAFIEAWEAMAASFAALKRPPLWGTLIRSASEPNVFYSFGPWRNQADIEEMRSDADAQHAMAGVRELCEEALTGMYHVIKHVEVAAGPAGG